tara:strand:- start:17240 stop:17425 length:186 start_codon:yes stop_codon:yes gene_type:complete
MNYQLILTVWLLLHLVASTVKSIQFKRLQGKDENDVIAAVIGGLFRVIAWFFCLWAGGFYL